TVAVAQSNRLSGGDTCRPDKTSGLQTTAIDQSYRSSQCERCHSQRTCKLHTVAVTCPQWLPECDRRRIARISCMRATSDPEAPVPHQLEGRRPAIAGEMQEPYVAGPQLHESDRHSAKRIGRVSTTPIFGPQLHGSNERWSEESSRL